MNVKDHRVVPHPPDKIKTSNNKKSSSHASPSKPRDTPPSFRHLADGPGHRLREKPSPKAFRTSLTQSKSGQSKKTPPLHSPVLGIAVERSKSRDSFSKYNCLPSIKPSSNEQSEVNDDNCQSKIIDPSIRKRGRTYGDTFALSDQMESMHINDSKRARSVENPVDFKETENATKDASQTSRPLKDEDFDIKLAIRLPKGTRMEETFKGSSQLRDILLSISTKWKRDISFKEYAIYTNEVPKRELKKPKSTLKDLGIVDKSVLVVEKRE